MPGKVKPTSIISSQLFSGSTPLSHDDFLALSVDSFGKPAEKLLDDLNWSKEVICLTGLKLSPDNLRVVKIAQYSSWALYLKINELTCPITGLSTTQPLSPFPYQMLQSSDSTTAPCTRIMLTPLRLTSPSLNRTPPLAPIS